MGGATAHRLGPMAIVRQSAALLFLFALGAAVAASADFLIDVMRAKPGTLAPSLSSPVIGSECFGKSSLRGCGGVADAHLEIPARSPEFVHHRSETSRYRRASLGVGRLDLRLRRSDDANITVPCTGFLVGEKHIITAHHCVDPDGTDSEVLEALFILGFTYGDNGIAFRVNATPVESCAGNSSGASCGELDFAIFELSAGEGERARSLGFQSVRLDNRDLQPGDDLFILHHPAGRPLALSIENCAVISSSGNAAFFHGCWTFGGSSGAPIFSDETNGVVAMHLRAIDGIASRDRRGVGVKINALIRKSAALREIGAPISGAGANEEDVQ